MVCSDCEKATSLLLEKDKAIKNLSDVLSRQKLQSKAKITQLQRQLQQLQSENFVITDVSHDSILAAEISELNALLAAKESESKDHQLRIKSLEEQLQRNEDAKFRIPSKNDPKTFEALQKELDLMYQQVVHKDEKIFELNQLVEERDTKILDLQEMCREKDQVIQGKAKAVQILHQHLQQYEERIGDLSEQLEVLGVERRDVRNTSPSPFASSGSLPGTAVPATASTNIDTAHAKPGDEEKNMHTLNNRLTGMLKQIETLENRLVTMETQPFPVAHGTASTSSTAPESDGVNSPLPQQGKKRSKKRVTFDLSEVEREAHVHALEEQLVEAEAIITELRQEMDSLTLQLGEMTEKLDASVDKNEHERIVAELQLQVDLNCKQAQQVLQDLDEERRENQNRMLKLKAQQQSRLRELEDKMGELQTKNSFAAIPATITEESQITNGEMLAYPAKCDAESQCALLNAQDHDLLAQRVQDNCRELDSVSQQLATEKDTAQKLHRELEASLADKRSIESRLAAASANFEHQSMEKAVQLSKALDDVTNYRDALVERNRELTKLRTLLDACDAEIRTLQAELATAKEDNASLRATVSESHDALSASEDMVTVLRQELAVRKHEYAGLMDQSEGRWHDLQHLRTEFEYSQSDMLRELGDSKLRTKAYEAKCKNLEQTLDVVVGERERARNELHIERDNAALWRNQLDELRNANDALEERYTQTLQELHDSRDTIAKLENSIDDLRCDRHELNEQLFDLSEELRDIKAENSDLRQDTHSYDNIEDHEDWRQMHSELEELKAVVETSEELVGTLEAELSQAREEGDALRSRLTEYETLLQQLQTQQGSIKIELERELIEHRLKSKAYDTKLRSMEQEKAQLMADGAVLQKLNDELQTKCQALQEALKESQRAHDVLAEQNSTLLQRCADAEGYCRTKTERESTLSKQLCDVGYEKENLADELKAADRAKGTLSAQVERLQAENRALGQAKQGLLDEKADIENELHKLWESERSLKTKLADYESYCADLVEKNGALESLYQSLRNQEIELSNKFEAVSAELERSKNEALRHRESAVLLQTSAGQEATRAVAELQAAKEHLNDLQRRCAALETQLQDSKRREQDLLEDRTSVVAARDELSRRCEELETTLMLQQEKAEHELSTRRDACEKLQDAVVDLQNAMGRQQVDLNDANAKLVDQQHILENNQVQLGNATAQIQNLVREQQTNFSETQSLRAQLDQANFALSAYQQQITEENGSMLASARNMEALQQQCNVLQAELDAARAINQAAQNSAARRIEDLEHALADSSERLAQRNQELAAALARQETNTASVTNKDPQIILEELVVVMEQCAYWKGEAKNLKDKLSLLQQTLDAAQQAAAKVALDNSRLQNELQCGGEQTEYLLGEHRSTIDSLRSANEELQSSLVLRDSKLAQLTAERNELRSGLDALQERRGSESDTQTVGAADANDVRAVYEELSTLRHERVHFSQERQSLCEEIVQLNTHLNDSHLQTEGQRIVIEGLNKSIEALIAENEQLKGAGSLAEHVGDASTDSAELDELRKAYAQLTEYYGQLQVAYSTLYEQYDALDRGHAARRCQDQATGPDNEVQANAAVQVDDEVAGAELLMVNQELTSRISELSGLKILQESSALGLEELRAERNKLAQDLAWWKNDCQNAKEMAALQFQELHGLKELVKVEEKKWHDEIVERQRAAAELTAMKSLLDDASRARIEFQEERSKFEENVIELQAEIANLQMDLTEKHALLRRAAEAEATMRSELTELESLRSQADLLADCDKELVAVQHEKTVVQESLNRLSMEFAEMSAEKETISSQLNLTTSSLRAAEFSLKEKSEHCDSLKGECEEMKRRLEEYHDMVDKVSALEQLEQKLGQTEAALMEKAEIIADLEQILDDQREESALMMDELKAKGESLEEMERTLNDAERETAAKTAECQELQSALTQLKAELQKQAEEMSTTADLLREQLKVLESERNSVAANLHSKEAEMEAIRGDLDKMKAQFAIVETRLYESEAAMEDVKDQDGRAKSQLAHLESNLQASEVALQSARSELESVKEQLKQAEEERERVAAEKSRLETEVFPVYAEAINQWQASYSALQSQHETTAADLELARKEASGALEQLHANLAMESDALRTQLSVAEDRLLKAEQEQQQRLAEVETNSASAVEKACDALRRDVQHYLEEIAALTTSCDQQKAALESKNFDFEKLQWENQELQLQITKASNSTERLLVEFNKEKQDLTHNCVILTEKLATLEGAYEQLKAEKIQIEERLLISHTELEKYATNSDSLNVLQQQWLAAQEEVLSLRTANTELRVQGDGQAESSVQMESTIARLTSEIERLTGESLASKNEAAALRRHCEELADEVDKLDNSVSRGDMDRAVIELGELRMQQASLKQSIADAQADAYNWQQQHSKVSEELARIQALAAESSGDLVQELRKQLAGSAEQIRVLQLKNEQQSTEAKIHVEDMLHMQAQLADYANNVEKLVADCEALKLKCEEFTVDNDRLHAIANCSVPRVDLDHVVDELFQLRLQHEQLLLQMAPHTQTTNEVAIHAANAQESDIVQQLQREMEEVRMEKESLHRRNEELCAVKDELITKITELRQSFDEVSDHFVQEKQALEGEISRLRERSAAFANQAAGAAVVSSELKSLLERCEADRSTIKQQLEAANNEQDRLLQQVEQLTAELVSNKDSVQPLTTVAVEQGTSRKQESTDDDDGSQSFSETLQQHDVLAKEQSQCPEAGKQQRCEDCGVLQQQIVALNLELDCCSRDLSQTKALLLARDELLSSVTAEFEKLKTQHRSLEYNHSEVQHLQERLAASEMELEALRLRLEQTEAQLLEIRSSSEIAISNKDEEVQLLRLRSFELHKELDRVSGEHDDVCEAFTAERNALLKQVSTQQGRVIRESDLSQDPEGLPTELMEIRRLLQVERQYRTQECKRLEHERLLSVQQAHVAEQKVQEVEATLQTRDAQLAEAVAEVEQLRCSLQEQVECFERTSVAIGNLRTDNEALMEQIATMSVDRRDLEAELLRIQTQYTDQVTAATELNTMIRDIQLEKERYTSELEAQRADNTQTVVELKTVLKDRETAIAQLQSSLEQCKLEGENNSSRRQQVDDECTMLRAQLDELQRMSDSWAVERQELHTDVDQLMADFGGAQERVAALQTENSALSERATRLLGDVASMPTLRADNLKLKEQYDSLKTSLQLAAQDNEDLRAQISQLTLKLEDANKLINERETLTEQLQRRLQEQDDLQVQLDQLMQEKDAAKTSVDQAAQEQVAIKMEMQRVTEQKDHIEVQLHQSATELRDVQMQLEVVVQEKETLRQQLDKAAADLEAAKIDLNDMVNENEMLMAQLEPLVQEKERMKEQLHLSLRENDNLKTLHDEVTREKEAVRTQLDGVLREVGVAQEQAADAMREARRVEELLRAAISEKSEFTTQLEQLALERECLKVELGTVVQGTDSVKEDLRLSIAEREDLKILLDRANLENGAVRKQLDDAFEELRNRTPSNYESDSMKAQLDQAEAEKDALVTQLEQAIMENDKLQTEIALLVQKDDGLARKELDEAQQERDRFKVQYEELEATNWTLEQTCQEHAEEIETLRQERTRLGERLAMLQVEQETLRRSATDTASRLEESGMSKRDELSSLQEQNQALRADCDTLEQDLDATRAQFSLLTQKLEQSDRLNAQLTEGLKASELLNQELRKQLQTHSDSLSVQHEAGVAALLGDNNALTQTVAELRKILEQTERTLAESRRNEATCSRHLADTENEVSALTNREATLLQAHNQQLGQIATLTTERETASQQIQGLNEELMYSQAVVADLTCRAETGEAKVAKLQSELEAIKNHEVSLVQERDRLAEECSYFEHCQMELETMRAKMNASMNDVQLLANLEETVQRLRSSNEQLAARCDSTLQDCALLERKLEYANLKMAEGEVLHEQVKEKEARISELIEHTRGYKDKQDGLESELNITKEKCAALEAKLQQTAEETRTLQDRLTAARSESPIDSVSIGGFDEAPSADTAPLLPEDPGRSRSIVNALRSATPRWNVLRLRRLAGSLRGPALARVATALYVVLIHLAVIVLWFRC